MKIKQLNKSWITQLFTHKTQTRDDLLEVLRQSCVQGLLDDDVLSIVEGAIQVGDMQARDVMTPRSQIISVSEDQCMTEFIQQMVDSTHSRFPVVGATRDEIIGILLVKDLLSIHLKKDTFKLKDHIRSVTFIPESKRLNVLLRELRTNRNHMAIVVDEFGGVAGLITIEDILEQIVGDIEDETDIDEGMLIKSVEGDTNSFLVKAVMSIDDFNEELSANLQSNEFDTMGGVVIQLFGYMPAPGDAVIHMGYNFEIVAADRRRIKLLKVSKLQ